MTKDEAISKIRKLLNRNGRTEAECDTAQMLAAAIAERHQIEIAEIDLADERRELVVTHKQVGEWAKAPIEADCAAIICKRFFEVSSFTNVGWMESIIFVGIDRHIVVAEYVFNFLLHEFRWLWRKRRGRCRDRKQFIYGCFIALHRKLNERFASSNPSTAVEISWRAKRDQYIKDQFGEMTTSPVANQKGTSAARLHGYRAGQEIEIRPGLSTSGKAAPQLGFEGRLLTDGRTK